MLLNNVQVKYCESTSNSKKYSVQLCLELSLLALKLENSSTFSIKQLQIEAKFGRKWHAEAWNTKFHHLVQWQLIRDNGRPYRLYAEYLHKEQTFNNRCAVSTANTLQILSSSVSISCPRTVFSQSKS